MVSKLLRDDLVLVLWLAGCICMLSDTSEFALIIMVSVPSELIELALIIIDSVTFDPPVPILIMWMLSVSSELAYILMLSVMSESLFMMINGLFSDWSMDYYDYILPGSNDYLLDNLKVADLGIF